MRWLPVTGRDGAVRAWTVVDNVDYDRVRGRRWHFCNGYVATSTGGEEVYLHRLIMDAKPGQEVDHRRGNRLDHRRSQLRVVTPDQNKQNLPVHRDNQSGHRGVSWAAHVKLWRGRVYHKGRVYDCGYHRTPEEAATAVSQKRAEVMTHSEEARHGPATVR